MNALGIAAAFEIEDAAIAPTMLVIANQLPRGIRRQRGLASAGQAEEQRHAAIRADVGGTMHGHHVLGGEQGIEHGEDGFLHLAGIFGSSDENGALLEVESNAGLGTGAVFLGIGVKGGSKKNGELRYVIFGLERI